MSSSGEKTEKPTDKRLRDARKKGQISKSQDLTSALMLISAVLVFWLSGTMTAAVLIGAMQRGIENAGSFTGTLTRETSEKMLLQATWDFAVALAPLFLFLFAGGILFNFVQVGALIAFDGIKPDLSKLNPTEGFKQKFLKARPYLELGKTMLKSLITFVVVGSVLYYEIPNVVLLAEQPMATVFVYLFSLLLRIGFYVGLLFVGLAVGDFFLQRLLFLNQMKMTKQEVRREYKESEGDPLIKWMRKSLHREILAQSSAAAVKTADVVLVNPTHVAVALKYDKAAMSAPIVVAKGADFIAKQIRELALKSDVPIMRDVPLARALYEINVDEEVPEEMYETIAEVLRWAYSLSEESKEQ